MNSAQLKRNDLLFESEHFEKKTHHPFVFSVLDNGPLLSITSLTVVGTFQTYLHTENGNVVTILHKLQRTREEKQHEMFVSGWVCPFWASVGKSSILGSVLIYLWSLILLMFTTKTRSDGDRSDDLV